MDPGIVSWFRRPDPEAWGHRQSLPDSMHLDGRVIFVEGGEDTLLIDCIGQDDLFVGCDGIEPGQPFTLEVEIPGDGWLMAALTTLDRWAVDGRLVAIEVTSTPAPRVQMSDETSAVVLDLWAVIAS